MPLARSAGRRDVGWLGHLLEFFEAEQYHHDYAARNPNQPYIHGVSEPKVAKLKKVHADLLKSR